MSNRIRVRGTTRAVLNTTETADEITYLLECGHKIVRPAAKWGTCGRRGDPNLERMDCKTCAMEKASA